MMNPLSIGYSPCPNDTFIFYALTHGRIDTGDLRFKEILEDVEGLNKLALGGKLDITKVSYHAFLFLRDRYCLLRSGGALGRGCGPLIVATDSYEMKDLIGKKIAIPGRLTTAFLLLKLYNPSFKENIAVMPFHKIMGAVKNGDVDAGLIIHEGRFTYPLYGLKKVIDLGKWWENETGLPIPLGCVLAKLSLGDNKIREIGGLIRKSVEYALSHREEPMGYIKEQSQELSDDVIGQHIDLYVNNYSIDIGEDGQRAIDELIKRAADAGL